MNVVIALLAGAAPFDALRPDERQEQIEQLTDEQLIWASEGEDYPAAATDAATAEILRRLDRAEMRKLACAG